MKILCVFGEHNYGNPARGLSYEYANFVPTLRNLGHEVTHFESWNRVVHKNFADLNRAFLDVVERIRPDVIFCVLLHYELWVEVLEAVRQKCPAILVHWGTDDSWKYEQFSRWIAGPFHVYATTAHEAADKAKRDGRTNFVLTQWAANSASLAEPLPASQCRHSVSFIGSAYGNRPRWIAQLRERGINVSCFGYGWPNGPVTAEDIPQIVRNSVVSLNFGDSGLHLGKFGFYRSRQIKARVFEVPGAGGCLLTESAPHLSDYYVPGREIATFNGRDNLSEKINWLLSHPEARDAIARAGYERTAREHTYEKRFSQLLDMVTKGRSASIPQENRGCNFERQWFSELRYRHEIGWFMRAIRQVLVKTFTVFFGSRRGSRAARRLVYELSWRLSGKRTFTSSGMPGRMFYRES